MSRKSKRRSTRWDAGSNVARPPELQTYPVWDVATRLMHLSLVVLLVLLISSVYLSWVPVAVHLWSGYLLLVVLLLRLGWGVFGSDSARFARFVGGPAAIRAYLPRLLSRRPTRWPGHNPIGALYVVAITALLLGASITGLFYENWGEWRGPLAERVSRTQVLWLSDLHSILQWPILALISIHVGAVLGYRLFKSDDRIGPMFGRGRIRLESDPGLGFVSMGRAGLLLVLALLAVLAVLWFGPVV